MAIKNRGEIVSPTEQINLTVQFKDAMGNPVDTDSFPQISIVQPSGAVFLLPTSVGVARVSTGKYSYVFSSAINSSLGVWNDNWVAYIGGVRVEALFSFIINTTQLPGVDIDGYQQLGNDPGFNYSQAAINNINKLVKALRARLNSSGKAKSTDSFGNVVYLDCDIFSVDMLVTFLASALWDFNQVPFFTFFQFDDDNFVNQFGGILVEGATLSALASKALIERGRELSITDQGVSFTPPTVSELMNTQYSTLLTHYFDKLKMIKASLRPHPLGLGVFGMGSGAVNPAIKRLGHLRARRIV